TLLIAGGVALVLVLLLTVLFRLFRQFSDAAMALVLERRFPKELGDRLITAVELSDPQEAEKYGYSSQLIRETIHEAADRVNQLPVGGVFDWKRLVRRGLLFVGLTAGLYALAVAGFAAVWAVSSEKDAMAGVGEFHDVATIWAERNVLLRNT